MSTDSPRPTVAHRVVLIDTRHERRDLMRHVVGGEDAVAVVVGEADNTTAALAVVDDEKADAVVLDVQMPVTEGLATISALRARFPQLGIIVCSFDLKEETVQLVLAAGADRCLRKPVNRRDIHVALAGLRPEEPPAEDSEGSPAGPVQQSAAVAG